MGQISSRATPAAAANPNIARRRVVKNADIQKNGKPFAIAVAAATLGMLGVAPISGAEAQILGSAESFGVLGGSTVTNTGDSIVSGDVGVSPGSAITGFPPGIVVAPGTIHAGDAVAAQARTDAITAYKTLAAMPTGVNLTGTDLGGLTLSPNVYGFSTSAQLTGLLTLNGQGNTSSEWVFKIGTTLTTASGSAVLLINGANGNNVYWAVGSSATLGTNTAFAGNIIAQQSITLNTGATISCGRALAINGAVAMDTNTISLCVTGPAGGHNVTMNQLFGAGVSGAQETAFGASRLFGSAMIGQALFWRSGGPDLNGITPLSLKDAGGPAAFAGDARTWRLWTAGIGETASFRGDSATNSGYLDTGTAGFAVGFDYQVSPTALAGIAGGYTNSTFSANQLQTSGTVEGAHIGLYGVKNLGQAYLIGTAEYARYYNDTNRSLQWLTLSEQATGKFTGDDISGRIEAGWQRSFGGYDVTPFAAVDASYLSSDRFSENSVGLLGLTFGAESVTSLRSSLGLQFDTRIASFYGQTFVPFVRLAWVHEFDPARGVSSFLTSSPDATFSPLGLSAASDSAKIDTGVKFDLTGRIALFAQFDGEFSGQGQSYGGNAGFKIQW